MRKILLTTLTLLAFGAAFGQSFVYDWHGAAAYTQYLNTVARDGYVYINGYGLSGPPVDFDPTTGIDTISDPTNDIRFVLKMTEEGGYEWANRLEGLGLEISSIGVSSAGLVAVSGYTNTAGLDLDPGPAVVGSYTSFSRIAFLAFYSSQGSYVGHIEYDGNLMYISSIALDGGDNLYFAGTIEDTLDMDFGTGLDLVPASAPTGFVAKINLGSNEYVSTLIFPPRPNSYSRILKLKSNQDRIVVLGAANGHQIDLDPTPGFNLATSIATDSLYDWAFYSVLDSSGAFVSGANLSSQGEDVEALDVALDHQGRVSLMVQTYSNGNMLSLTNQGNTISFAIGPNDPYYLFHFDALGSLSWRKTMGPYNNVNIGGLATNDTIIAVVGTVNDSIEIGDGTSNLVFGPYQPNTSSRFLALFETSGRYIGLDSDQPSIVPTLFMASNGKDVSIGSGNSFFIVDRLYYCPCDYDLDPSGSIVSTLATDTAMIHGGGYILRLNLDGFVSTQDVKAPAEVMLYPNPASDRISVVSEVALSDYSVYDLQGRQLLVRSFSPIQKFQVDLSSLGSGMYLIELGNAEGKVSRRIVKL